MAFAPGSAVIGGNGSPSCDSVTNGAGTVIFESFGYNLDQADDCPMTGDTGSNLVSVDPMLGPLQDNGGSTMTIAPAASSLARNGGNSNGCVDDDDTTLTTDQRGQPRPQKTICDIGAVEYQQ